MLRHESRASTLGHIKSSLNLVLFISSIGDSLIGLFIPFILFRVGYSFTQVMLFFLITYLALIPLQWLSLKCIAKYGIEKTILFSAIPSALFYILLMFVTSQFWVLFLISLISAFADIFFWMPYHFDYLLVTKKEETGASSGSMIGLQIVGNTLGPVVGGIILTWWTKNILILIAAICSLAYAIPLFANKTDKKIRVPFCAKVDVNAFAFFCEGVTRASFAVIWPIYLFVSGITVLALGVLYTGARLGVGVATTLFGKFTDHHNNNKMFVGFTLASTADYASRLFLLTPLLVAVVTVLGEVLFTFMNVPFTKRWLDLAKKNGPQVLVQREIMLNIGRLALVSVVAIIGVQSILFACIIGLLLGAIATLGLLFIENPSENR